MQTHPISGAAECPAAKVDVKASEAQTIPVTNGPLAHCDPEDFAFLSRFTWYPERDGSLDYAVTRIDGRTLYMHHAVLMSGKKRRVVHDDGNGFNNRRANLRVAACGQVYAGKLKLATTSQYKGVHQPKGSVRWVASIGVKGANWKLGRFDHEEDAARAYDAAAREAFGAFAYQNFPPKQ